jgi:5-methyltetrahydrofolate--homocysteine methyltransferase
MSLTSDIYDAVVAGDRNTADRLVVEALGAGIPAEAILRDGLIAAMAEVGKRFECGDYYVAEMLVSAQALKAGMQHLRPHLAAAAIQPVGVVVIGTVKGDLHDIGKNVVGLMLEGAGFQVVDLGVDVTARRFVEAAKESGADLVALSALLTTTMPEMRTVVEAFQAERPQCRTQILIGGAPITQQFADQIGADGFAPDAAVAARRAREMVGLSA